MGFFGRMRKWILKSSKNGKLDLELVSKSFIDDARATVKGADISPFFSNRYIRSVNGVAMIGEQALGDFVKWTRIGDFESSFGRAFRDNPAIKNIPIRNTLNNLLLESRRTLPDFRIRQSASLVESAKAVTGVDTRVMRNAVEVEAAVKKSSKLSSSMKSLFQRVNVTKTLKFLGFTVALGAAGALTYQVIYKKMEELAAEQSGCFAYWYSNDGTIRKCKVRSYSCKSGDKSPTPCIAGVLPADIIENKDCLTAENKEKNCLHCSGDDPVNVNLPENVTLRCEEKTAGDLLLEAISETVGNVWTGVGSLFSNLFWWGAILLVVIIVLVLLVNFLR